MAEKKVGFTSRIVQILQGAVIGTANIIPGVSGGTMAVILGIYPELTEAIGEFFSNKEKRKGFFFFLLMIFIGAAAGILGFAHLMTRLFAGATSSFITYAFFIGLIAGSIPFLFTLHKELKPSGPRVLLALAGVAPIVLLSLVGHGQAGVDGEAVMTAGYGLWLLVCGFLSAGSMIVPGFSGSALLVALGEYHAVLGFIDQRTLVPLGIFAAGAVLGILAFARLIDFCFKKFPSGTLYVVLGLLLGSLYQVFLEMNFLGLSIGTAAGAGGALLAGAALSLGLSRIRKPGETSL